MKIKDILIDAKYDISELSNKDLKDIQKSFETECKLMVEAIIIADIENFASNYASMYNLKKMEERK